MSEANSKTLSYTELSTYQLLCIKEIYHLIDLLCSEKFPDWDMEAFERQVVNGKSNFPFDEKSVRALIDSRLKEIDTVKPLKRYLEQGKHYAYELFLSPTPSREFDNRPFQLFWAYMAREFADLELPIEQDYCRKHYLSVLKRLNIRLYSQMYYNIERFLVKSYGEIIPLSERDVREALFTIERRNQAFRKRRPYNGEPAFLNKAEKRFGEFFSRIYPHSRLKRDFNVHDLCFAIDSCCTELQKSKTLLLWGVFTGEPLNYTECGRKCGVSGNCIRQCEDAVVRNTGHKGRYIIAENIAYDDEI